MTIECPRCGTRYRRPSRATLGAGSTYRCARCRHVFGGRDDEPAMIAEEGDDDEPRFTLEEPDDDPVAADTIVHRAPEPSARAEPLPAVRSPARFAVRCLVLVTLAYVVVSIYLVTHPELVRDVLGAVPLIGEDLAETHLQPTTVQLTNLHGEYQRVQGDRLVFVISGTAVNNSSLPVRGIQIEGRILGNQEQRQVVFCGAAPRDVQELSLREIALLQTLEPPKEWTLAPGDQASFLVVFPGPPTDLHEFGAEVVAVQAPLRRVA